MPQLPAIASPTTTWLALVIAVWLPTSAWAQDNDDSVPAARREVEGERIEIQGEPRELAARAPGFRTHIEIADHEGETRSLSDLLSDSVGVHVRSLGSMGGFTSISVRGASSEHTAVFIDGIPLSRLGMASQDLGAFDVGSFSSMELYRGAVPVELGGAAMGGAVDLRSFGALPPDRLGHLSVGIGSFGTMHTRASVQAATGAWRYVVGLGYRATAGDYDYFNDNGTPLLATDDRVEARSNNGFEKLHANTRLRRRWDDLSVEVGVRGSANRQGVPGVGSVQSTESSFDALQGLVDLRVQRVGDTLDWGVSGYALGSRQDYVDLLGEVGIGTQHNRYRNTSAGMSGTARLRLGKHHLLRAAFDSGGERFGLESRLDMETPAPSSRRLHAGAALADELRVGQLYIEPALRVDYQYTDPGNHWDPALFPIAELEPRHEPFLSPRLSLRYLTGPWVFKANAGRYFRAPTSTELFGDRGFIVGNPTLRSEYGEVADAGLVFLPELDRQSTIDQVHLEFALFAAYNRDAIALTPTSGMVAHAQNLGNARILGTESSLRLRAWRRLTWTVNHTFIDTKQDSPLSSYDGKQLPLRPRHELYSRVEGSASPFGRDAALWADVSATSGNFLDAANRSQVPRRVFVGAGLRTLVSANIALGAEVKNLFNERVESIRLDPPPRPDLTEVPRAVADFLGYPLPGRAFYLNLDSSF